MTERLPRLAGAAAALALALAAPAALARTSVNVSGSIYVDGWWLSKPQAAAQTVGGAVAPDGALKVSADVHDDLAVSAKACFGCHGVEVEHLSLEYTPRTWFNVSAGRVVIPFGEYSNRVDPGSHRTSSAPLIYDMGRMPYGDRTGFNLGVIPMPYVDTGVVLYGQRWIADRVQVWYGAYAVAGLRGTNDVDFMSMRSAYYGDNNRVPAGGGRLALTWSQQDPESLLGDVSVGGSYTAGRYDPAGSLGYSAWGLDAQARLGPVVLRAEYAARRTDLDPNAIGYRYVLVDGWFEKRGWYGELEAPVPFLGKYLGAVGRVDRLQRLGAPTPGMMPAIGPDASIYRYTAGLVFTPVTSLYLKASYEYWDISALGALHGVHAGIGGSF